MWGENSPDKGDAILVGNQSSDVIKSAGYDAPLLGQDDFILKTVDYPAGKKLLVCGGGITETLYAAYHLAEQTGIGFYLDGDVVPDQQVPFVLPELDVRQSPLFSRRGIQPFHDFPEGPDWWNQEDYKSVFSQLPKLLIILSAQGNCLTGMILERNICEILHHGPIRRMKRSFLTIWDQL